MAVIFNVWRRAFLRVQFCLFCLSLLFLQASPGAAADLTTLSLEELMEIRVAVIYGASKFEQKATEAPAYVSVVTREDIKRFGYRTLADILRSLPGFFGRFDHAYEYSGVRGFSRLGDYDTRLLLLVDGHRINGSVFGEAFLGMDFIVDIDMIERVEVIRGPGSSLYGSNAFFAVINVITRHGGDVGGAEISAEAASHDTFKGRLTYGTIPSDKAEVLASLSTFRRGGEKIYFPEYDTPATNNGVADKRDHERASNALTTLSYGPFTLQAAYVRRKKGIPTAYYETVFNDPRTSLTDALGYIDLKYEENLPGDLNAMARLFYDSYYYKGVYPYPETVNEDYAWGKTWGGELKLVKEISSRQRITVGFEFNDEFKLDQKNYDTDPYNLYLDDRRSSVFWAPYMQDEVRPLDNLIFNLGVRYDYYQSFGGTLNPRLAAIWSPLKKTTLKFIYGTAFRAPNAYESYYSDGDMTQKANHDLDPETITTYEFVLEQYCGTHMRIAASAFYYLVHNLIVLTTDPSDGLFVYRNVGRIRTKGTELEMEYRWRSGPRGRISYSFQETRDPDTGDTPPNSPRHLFKINFVLPFFKDAVFAGTEIQYTSSRITYAGNRAGGFVVANLTLSGSRLLKGLDWSLSVYNVFDRKYKDPASPESGVIDTISQEGTNFRLKVVYAF